MPTFVAFPMKLNVQAEGFVNEKHSTTDSLNLLIKEQDLSFCLVNAANEVQLLRSYHLPFDYIDNFSELFEQLLEQEPILRDFAGTTNLATSDLKASFVPKDFFANDNLALYYPKEHFDPKNEVLLADFVPAFDHHNVYSMPKSVWETFRAKYPNIQFKNTNSTLLDSILTAPFVEPDNTIVVNVSKDAMDVFILKNKQLAFHNSFHFKTPEDFLYYLTNSARQQGLDFKNAPLVLLGNVYKSGGLFKLIQHYFPNLSFGERSNKYQHKNLLGNYPAHLHYDLMAI